MRPFGTTQQLARRRQRALDLLRYGQSSTQVAQRIGATAHSVRRWRRESQHPKRKRRPSTPPGRPSYLSAFQLRRLVSALKRGACANGYAEDYWTLNRIAHLIWELFHVHYHPSGVWRVLQRVDWSCQKPQRRSLARDDEAIVHWKHFVWPHIRKKWRALGATLILLDESGVSLISPLKRTWAPRGHTPTIRTSLQHNERLNLIGALCVTPAERKIKLRLQSYRESISGDEVIRFLKHLLRHVKGPMVLVWDKHPIHRRRKVKDFLACHRRIHVYEFPTSAPELNPTEFVWTQISEYTASTAPHNSAELRANVFAGIARTRRSLRRLWVCILASDLPWKR